MSLIASAFDFTLTEASDKQVETSDRFEIVDERRVLTSEILFAFAVILSAFILTLVLMSEIESSTDCKSEPRAAIDAAFVAILLSELSKAVARP